MLSEMIIDFHQIKEWYYLVPELIPSPLKYKDHFKIKLQGVHCLFHWM